MWEVAEEARLKAKEESYRTYIGLKQGASMQSVFYFRVAVCHFLYAIVWRRVVVFVHLVYSSHAEVAVRDEKRYT